MREAELQSRISEAFGNRVWVTEALKPGLWPVALLGSLPDGSAAEFFVHAASDGTFSVTDLGETGRWLSGQGFALHRLGEVAEGILAGSGTRFESDTLSVSGLSERDVADALIDLAGLAARMVDAVTFSARSARPRSQFTRLVVETLIGRAPHLIQNPELRGASGRTYRPALLDPVRHTVVETLASRRSERLSAVYTEMSDLASANGFRPFVVLDDQEREWEQAEVGLLLQVAQVAYWGDRSSWIPEVFPVPEPE